MSSPFIRPVYVLPRDPERDQHYKGQLAKCTIDTGNHKGNIVSREFLVKTLGYEESDFLPLTELEKSQPGISATQHILSLLGAIHLAWYFDTSTQVYRDMRFLISPHSHCDLIIGARSIERHNMLGVPVLPLGGQVSSQTLRKFTLDILGIYLSSTNEETASSVQTPAQALRDAKNKLIKVKEDLIGLDKTKGKGKKLEEKRKILEIEFKIATKELELRDSTSKKRSKTVTDEIERELKELRAQLSKAVPETSASASNGGTSSSVSTQGKPHSRSAKQ